MKKDVSKWIDKEIERLEKETVGENPQETEANPVPDELKHALGKLSDNKPSQKK